MSREEWIEKAFQLYQREQRVYKVTAELQKAGFSQEESNEMVNEVIARMKQLRQTKKIKLFKWLSFILPVLGGGILLFGFYVLPNWYIRSAETIISFIVCGLGFGAILGGLILGRLAKEYTMPEPTNPDVPETSNFGYWVLAIAVGSLILFAFAGAFMSTKIEQRAVEILMENGVETIGWISSGEASEYRVKRSTVKEFVLTVVYRLKQSKKEIRTEIEVSEREFNSVYKGQKVKVIYSTKDAYHAKIVDYQAEF